jgi:adenine deaminase
VLNRRTSFDRDRLGRRRLRVALGQEPADLVLAEGEIVEVFAVHLRKPDI